MHEKNYIYNIQKPLWFSKLGLNIWGTVIFLAPEGDFSSIWNIQTGSGAHPPSYSMALGALYPRIKWPHTWSWPLTSIQCYG